MKGTNMSKTNSLIPTMQDLRTKWGDKRYVTALFKMTKSLIHVSPNLPNEKKIREWCETEPDVFDLFTAYVYHGSEGFNDRA